VLSTRKTCFVVSRIGEKGSPERRHADAVFHAIIKPALAPRDFRVIRIDRDDAPGYVTDDIVDYLLRAELVVADVTGPLPGSPGAGRWSPPNPNVMYELGIRHAWCRPTILIAHRTTKLPFDINGVSTIFYGDLESKAAMNEVRMRIRKQLRQIERGRGSVRAFDRALEEAAQPLCRRVTLNELRLVLDRFTFALGEVDREVTHESEPKRTDALRALASMALGHFDRLESASYVLQQFALESDDEELGDALKQVKNIVEKWRRIDDFANATRSSPSAVKRFGRILRGIERGARKLMRRLS